MLLEVPDDSNRWQFSLESGRPSCSGGTPPPIKPSAMSVSTPAFPAESSESAAAILALAAYFWYCGSAIMARMLMIATTIISSMREKPRCLDACVVARSAWETKVFMAVLEYVEAGGSAVVTLLQRHHRTHGPGSGSDAAGFGQKSFVTDVALAVPDARTSADKAQAGVAAAVRLVSFQVAAEPGDATWHKIHIKRRTART